MSSRLQEVTGFELKVELIPLDFAHPPFPQQVLDVFDAKIEMPGTVDQVHAMTYRAWDQGDIRDHPCERKRGHSKLLNREAEARKSLDRDDAQ